MPQTCSRCFYTSLHPFGMTFLDNVCSGCVTHEEKYALDWGVKHQRLIHLLKKHSRKNRGYDCVVPVVGDAEDYFTLETILNAGMAPLVVCVNSYFMNDIGWHNLHHLITHFDVDSFVFNPDMTVYRELVRTSLRKYDHVLLPYLQLHTSFPVHVAQQRKIPLIVWGQHQAIEQVGKFSHNDEAQMSRWSRKEHDLFNVDTDGLIGNGAQVQERQLHYYHYPQPKSLHSSDVTGIYLSNFIPWDPLAQNHRAIAHGFSPQYQTSTFDPYERAGNSVYFGIHDLLKYKRVGYRKIDDHLTRELRHKRLTIPQARAVHQHYSKSRVDLTGFFNWLEVTESGYQWFVDHRLSDVGHLIGTPEWPGGAAASLPDSVSTLIDGAAVPETEFITFGKGIDI